MIQATTHADSSQRVLLIDLDNCPQHLAKLPLELTRFMRIIACHGSVEPRLGLSLVTALAAAIQEGRIQFVAMPTKGKNAADFGLAFWAGRLLAETPPDTEFVIVSGDQDLDHVVALLRHENRAARRIGKDGELDLMIDEGATEAYIAARLRPGTPRPKRRQTLRKSIRSFFQKNPNSDVSGVLDELISLGVVRIDEDELVTYCDDLCS